MENRLIKNLVNAVWRHYKENKRPMPWRETRDPYGIVVSELMLQQTQVSRVLVKYPSFLKRFPTWKALAAASQADVVREWQGLGYNRRALYLKRMAEEVVGRFGGVLPEDPALLAQLPGIGNATAAAIAVYAFGAAVPFIETNVRSVFIYHCFKDQQEIRDAEIMPLVERALDRNSPREWYWALMDYGTHLKKELKNPSRKSAHHVRQSKFEGSMRQARGAALRCVERGSVTFAQCVAISGIDELRLKKAFRELAAEGFLVQNGKKYNLA